MNRPPFPILVAALIAAALIGARTAAAQAVLQRCDKPMADAELAVQTVADCSDFLAASRAAVSQVSSLPKTDTRVAKVEYSTTPVPSHIEKAAKLEPVAGHLFDYYVYTAFAAGDASLCSSLEPDSTVRKCRQNVGKLTLRRAFAGPEPDLVRECINSEKDAADASTASCCALIAQARGRPDVCAKLVAKCETDAASCRALSASSAGDPGPCKNLPMPTEACDVTHDCEKARKMEVAKCEAVATFVRAAKAKDIGLCGGLQECRVLMGAGKEVAKEIADKHLQNLVGDWYLKSRWKKPYPMAVKWVAGAPAAAAAGSPTAKKPPEFKGFVCADVVSSVENRRVVTSVLNLAHACLTDVETALQTPTREVIEGIDARMEKLARLNLRLGKHFREVLAVKSPAAPAAR